ncbi:kinase-like protein [Aspergillus ibericus CBS 121593]|uniref:Kinase-like protein n=1 Tax=Aspergillus ibericus CBS 121593 TaxID=1448316 RepID=A0A395H0A0_9EURO|nr:kinase-like protein [Aspergillus ibericus CBS 121593]RAL00735.1 kinase-like protein [Aspergillus ibericus CBS 121593]
MIRKLVDYIPDSEPAGPMMVLEAFTDTLWDVRRMRALSMREIKWIMKGVLLGVWTVHMRGLVYTDLKMENIVLGGFDPDQPNENVKDVIVRLADCGGIRKPSTEKITALTYRSPEVHFNKPWDQSTDVWSWGIILAQLLQAQVGFHAPGIYDTLNPLPQLVPKTAVEKEHALRDQLAIDFDLSSVPFYADCREELPPPQPEQAYMWANTMVEKGVAAEDVQFLVEVLHPDPRARITVREILEGGYLG